MERYVVVDLEMTGLRIKNDRILEIGAVKIEDGAVADTFQTLVNPRRKLSDEVSALTKITGGMLADAPYEGEALEAFLDFAEEYPLIGHNLMYDYRFLKQCAVNHDKTFERKGIDTLKIARKLLEEPEKKSLDSLCAYFSIERRDAHRALSDAMATARLFLLLRERYAASAEELFIPKPLLFKVKKQGAATPAQKRDLNHLLIYHRIESDVELDSLTKSEASRMIDRIYAAYGRAPARERSEDV